MKLAEIAERINVHLRKAEAMAYLAWLDAGNRGKHFEMETANTRPPSRA